MQYIGSNIRFIFTKIKELLNSHNTDNSAHSELFKSWKRLRNPNNADIADALAATYKNGIGDVLVEVKDDTTFALEDMKLFFRPASFKLISANESNYEGIYITMDGTQGRYVAKTFADSEVMMPEGPTTISTPSELVLYPAASDAVLYTPQTLTDEQQKQARTNIGALDVNIKTTPVDIGVGSGSTVYYVQSGWLRPCPDNADNELILQYRRVFDAIGLQRGEPNSEDILLRAKSAYSLYQKGLASESITVTNDPLNATRVYVTWNIVTRRNKHYIYYAQVSTAYQYDCTYCVEDDALINEGYKRPVYSTSNGVGNQTKVSQFRMSAAPTEDMHVATKQYVDIAKTEAQQLGLTAATPGKTIKVKTVQDGKPTEWEVADIYEKPADGIPKSDLADDVQTSLAKADTAISYTPQTLTEEQQAQARTNIGALDVNVGTTPVDTNRTFFGVGKNIVYVKNGWLKPCPADADKELANNYANAVLGFGFINLDISVVKGEAKSAFSLYQQGLISDKGTILKNPLDVAQYITWTVGITNNKTYIDYRHVEHNGFYEYCRYFEDDTYSNLRASYSLTNLMDESNPRGTVGQYVMSTNPTKDMHIATKQYVDTAKTEAQQLGLTTATPGKTIKVKTVQNGKPTEWEVADMPSQPDWNQNDNTKPDYIKNRPLIATNDDAMDLLAEIGIITPITNSNGEILTSSSNEIYSL